MKLLFKYLLLSGLLTHLLVVAVFLHFRTTGLTPHRYVTKGVQVLDRDGSATRHLARAARLILLDSGLVSDPITKYPPNVTIELPRWRGTGANALRKDTAPRYTSAGVPIATTERNQWVLNVPPSVRSVSVDSVAALEEAIEQARPGEEVVLKPGRYRLSNGLKLQRNGSPRKPLILRGETLGAVIIEVPDRGRVAVSGKYWTVSDLIVRGHCGNQPCPYLFETGAEADGFTVRNLFVSGIRLLINSPVEAEPVVAGLVDGVTVVGGRVATSALHWPQHAIREVAIPLGADQFVVMCTKKSGELNCDTDNLSHAAKNIAEGGLLLIRTGIYEQAAILRKNNIHLLAEPGATLYKKSIEGKGALVVNANTTIEGLACSHIRANDGNGSCVRQQKGDVTLIGVHFHHSQMGVLTGHNGGSIKILDSYFHDSGYDESGNLGHNVYVNSGMLEFVRSWSIAARNAGHELKSRAERTVILDSLLASINARDSRLIDIPNGGLLEVRGSVLGEGPRSENEDMVGYGLEIKGDKPRYKINSVKIRSNTIYVDRPQGARLLHEKHVKSIEISENMVIGKISIPRGNTQFDDREEADVAPYPSLSPQTF